MKHDDHSDRTWDWFDIEDTLEQEAAQRGLLSSPVIVDAPRRAVLYLRVSTPSQVKTDYDPEGISLPAQRTACQRKAEQLGLEVVEEYVEPGRTATSMAGRVAFRDMLRRIKTERDVDVVLVYKLSRMNRNRIDDALVMAELRKYGVALVSATENIDESPLGQLMHGILATINEFRSMEDGADVRYKMGEKAKKGGTISKAPLGYLNVIERFEGREVRTVALDPERSELVKLAFELYATGDYTLDSLSDELYERGLRSRPGRYPSTRVSDSKLAQLLRNRYYLGRVIYQGDEFEGRHEALVTEKLFGQVQEVLSRKAKGERQRKFQHTLKGMLWCGACDRAGRARRMILHEARGNGGAYLYFFCRGRQAHECSEPYLNADQVEAAVMEHLSTIRFTPAFLQVARTAVFRVLADEQQADRTLRQQLATQLARLDAQESNLIDLAADTPGARQKVRQKLLAIESEREQLRSRLDGVDTDLRAGVDLLEASLAVLEQPDELYRRTTDQGRRLKKKIFEFERLEQIRIPCHRSVGDADVREAVPHFSQSLFAFLQNIARPKHRCETLHCALHFEPELRGGCLALGVTELVEPGDARRAGVSR